MENLNSQKSETSYEDVLALFKETSIQLKENSSQFKEIREQFKETREQFKEIGKFIKETEEQMKDTDLKMKETDRQIKELGKQIGGLGNKFGGFTEGLFTPSVLRILSEKFKCINNTSRYRFKDNGNSFEIDVLGVSINTCYIVEIKSYLKSEAIAQLEKIIEKMNNFDTKFIAYKKVGIIVATDFSEEAMKEVINAGFYFIRAEDDIAKLEVPDDFQPRIWESNEYI